MCPLKAILVLKICVNLYLALEPPTPEIVNLRAATDCYLAMYLCEVGLRVKCAKLTRIRL